MRSCPPVKNRIASGEVSKMGWKKSAALLSLMAWLLFIGTPSSAQQLLDRIVAVVDDEIILLSELKLQLQLARWEQQMASPKTRTQTEELKRELLERMIDDRVLLAKAKEDSIEVRRSEVKKALTAQIEELTDRFGSKEALNAQLESQGLNLGELKRRYRRDIRDQLLKEKLMRTKMAGINVSRREVEEFYKTHRDSLPKQEEAIKISHILLRASPGEEVVARALEKIRAILEDVRSGADFAELARKYSEDQATAENGGDLGFFRRGDFGLPKFEEVAFSLQPGEVSDIVKTRLGYHLIKLEEKRGDQIRVRHILVKAMPTEKDKEGIKQRIERLREKILAGEDFATVAREYSEDAKTRAKGGELGWFLVEQIPPQFKPIITDLKVGEVSQPVRSSLGYHLIRLDDRQEHRRLTLDRDWETVENLARQEKVRREFERWLKELREEIYVDVRLKG